MDMTIHARDVVKGDVVRLEVGWRNVLDVWQAAGFTHVVASDATGMWKSGEEVEVARRPQPPKLAVVRDLSPRRRSHAAGLDCGERYCVACWRDGRRPSPVHRAEATA